MRGAACASGVGELLAAHRALAAVDAAPREEAFFALRAALCSSHADLARVRRGVRGRLRRARRGARGPARAARARSSAPRCRASASRRELPGRRSTPSSRRCPPRGARRSCCASATSRVYTDAERAAARRLLARLARRGPQRVSRRTRADAAAPRGPRPARHDPRCRCATAASSSSAASARRRSGRAGSCSCSTSPARWRRTRGCCSSTCRPASRRARASRRSRSARG